MNIEMVNEIEQLAEQHGMTVEFVTWFFNEKKAGCGNVWFMMLAAMWEGWKGRAAESTAALATIEKCREVSGCPEGVDLQDHLRQLVAENVGLKEYRPEPYGIAMMEALDAFFADEEVPERAMMAAFEILCAKRMPTPATDRIVAGIKADGVLQYAENLDSAADDAERGGYDDAVKCLRSEASAARLFAAQLRKGAAK